jgi:hypothetical protein
MNANSFFAAAMLVFCWGMATADEPVTNSEQAESPGHSGAPSAASAKSDEATHEQIGRWIEQLDSDEYWTREDADKRLFRAGSAAIAPLTDAARSAELEVSMRAIGLLARFLELDDPAVESMVEAALEDIAASRVTSAAVRAEAALDGHRGNRQERVIAKLRQLGANVAPTIFSNGEIAAVRITIGEGWRGTVADLAALKRVPSLTHLSIYGGNIDDEAVKHLVALKQLTELQIYGTKISDAGVEKLTAALPPNSVDRRRGGLLGVHGDRSRNGGGCLVMSVAANTAASKAGLQPGDVITRFDGKEVEDFNALTNMIKDKAGDDSVELEFQRDVEVGEKTERQTLKKTVTLGHWTNAATSVNVEWEGQIILPGR